jgi:hypothetical protein
MTRASDLISDGICEGNCLTATSPRNQCHCRCGARYHGVLAEAEVGIGWTYKLTPASEIKTEAIQWIGAVDPNQRIHAATHNAVGRLYTACDRRGHRFRLLAPLYEERGGVAVDYARARHLWDGQTCQKCVRMVHLTRYVERHQAS